MRTKVPHRLSPLTARIAGVAVLLGVLAVPRGGSSEPSPSRFTVEPSPWMHASWDLFGFEDSTARVASTAKAVTEERFPWLPDERWGRSFSVGTVTDGYVVGAVLLPLPARTHAVLPRQFRRRLLWGTEELIEAIDAASAEVERAFPGSVLFVGNIGRRGGGDIPWSVSHNAGRDADLAFYTTDPEGQPIEPPDLLRYGADGRSREYGGYYRFDVPRNWALVRAFVTSEVAQVQYLFISNPLRALLLDHARRRGEAGWIVERAGRLLRQPGPEIPHDDHLHVRIYCSRADRGAGCQNRGAVHAGVVLHDDAMQERIETAVRLLRDDDPAVRGRALQRLGHLQARSAADAVTRRLSDPVPFVRWEALDVLGRIGGPSHAQRVVEQWEEEQDREVRGAMVRTLLRIGDRQSAEFLAFLLSSPERVVELGKEVRVALLVADRAAEERRADLVEALTLRAGARDRVLQRRIWTALEDLTCRASDEDEVDGGWGRWYAGSGGFAPTRWRTDGLAAAGYDLRGDARSLAAELARAAGDDRAWVRNNAQRWLMEMTGNAPASLTWSPRDARSYWTRWVRRNPSRVARR
jgi:hypothetical protein